MNVNKTFHQHNVLFQTKLSVLRTSFECNLNVLVNVSKLEPDHNVSVKALCECDIRTLELILEKYYPNVCTNITYFVKKELFLNVYGRYANVL